MAKALTILQVFVASPSDVVDERNVLVEIIKEFNLTWGDAHNVRLELVKWETHTRPGIGPHAQDVINRQIGDAYDIFLGIMWGRFGSPTDIAESGTEEEFERAYSRMKVSPGSVQIMFYFKDAGISPSKCDAEQLTKVQRFKNKIASEYGAIYHEFETTEEFRTKARIHLSREVQAWLEENPTKDAERKFTPPKRAANAEDPLAHLTGIIEGDEDEGLIDLMERANDSMLTLVGVLEKISDATRELGEKFTARTTDAKQLAASGSLIDPKAAKRISNTAADDIEIYVRRMSVEIPEFNKYHSLVMDTFGKVAMLSGSEFEGDPDNLKNSLQEIQTILEEIRTSSVSISEFRENVARLPRLTTALGRARRRAVAMTDDLIAQFQTAHKQTQDVEQLLKRLIDQKNSNN